MKSKSDFHKEKGLVELPRPWEPYLFARDLYYECQLCGDIFIPYFSETIACQCKNISGAEASSTFRVKDSSAIKVFRARPERPKEPVSQPACGCPAPLFRTILWNEEEVGRLDQKLDGCLHCGRAFYYEVTIEEPRPHDTRVTGFVLLPIEARHLQWLERWPRWACSTDEFYSNRRRPSFVGASFRYSSDEQLQSISLAQQELSLAERLKQAGTPREAPPLDLPKDFKVYVETWKVLGLLEISKGEELLRYLPLFKGFAGFVLADTIARQEHLVQILADELNKNSIGDCQPALCFVDIVRSHDQHLPEAIESNLFTPAAS